MYTLLKLFTTIIVLGGILIGTSTYGDSSKRLPKSLKVSITDNLTFEPDSIEVFVGDTIVWRNTSFLVHTVTCDTSLSTIKGSAVLPDGADPFNSGNLKPGEKYFVVLTVAGKYSYFCIPHEGAKMRGSILVKKK